MIHKIIHHNRRYTTVTNDLVRDPRVSATAFRLYAYINSHESGYELRYSQIERETGMKKYAIQNAIDNLKELGYLRTEQQKNENGRWGSLVWFLLDPHAGEPSTGDTVVDSLHSGETRPLKKTNNTKKLNNTKNINGDILRFDEFWELYPRKRDKGKAKKSYRTACKKTDEQTIIDSVKQYALEVEGKEATYIKYPASWLNAESWLNEVEETEEMRREREIRELLENDE